MAFLRHFSKGAWILAVVTLANLVLVIVFANNYLDKKRDQHLALILEGKEKTRLFAEQIEQKLPPIMEIADRIADDLSYGKLDSAALIERLGNDVEKYDYVDGLFVAYKPFKFDKDTEFFAPLFLKPRNAPRRLTFLKYDYTVKDWFQKPLLEGASWVEPFIGGVSGEVLIQYGVPIYDQKQEPQGIVAINFSPEEVNKIVSSSLPSGESGYGFLLSRKGTYIYHPIAQLVQDQQSIIESENEKLKAVAQKAIEGEEGMVETTDPLSMQKSRTFFKPISYSGWIVGIHSFDERAANDYRQDSIKLIWLMMGISSFLILLIIMLIQLYQGSEKSYWGVTTITSLLSILAIYFIWYRTINSPPIEELKENDLMIANEAVLKHFIEYQNSISEKRKQEIFYVPTGVFVQHIQFVSAYNVMVSGYVWQTYSKKDSVYSDGIPISRGFLFAEIEPNAEVLSIEEAYRKDLGDREVIGWYFRVSVRKHFDYRHYPFDQQRIWLRLWHQDFNRQVILIPDLDSYKIINPISLPGLEENFVLPQWSLRASFFDFKSNTYNTTFGVGSEFAKETKPELYFNIVVQRKFLGPFITNIIPLIVIAIIVFTVLTSAQKESSGDTFLGFSGFGVVELCAAFFFVVIISQIEIRDSLQVSGIIYLDYFFFLIYLMLLTVSINSILFTRTDTFELIEYKGNLIPKLIFWPLLLGILLIITRVIFY